MSQRDPVSHGLRLLLLPLWLVAACTDHRPQPVAADGWGPSGGLNEPALLDDPRRAPVPRASAIPAAKRRRWPRADELDALTAVPGRGMSEHLGVRYERSVLINETAESYRRLIPHQPLPVGTLVAQRHHPPGSDAVVSWYLMEKTPEGWRFLVLDPERRVAAREDLEPCLRCHAEAPHDHLFGPPPNTQRLEAGPSQEGAPTHQP